MARLAATSRIAAHRSAIKLDFSISHDRNSVLILCIIVVAVFCPGQYVCVCVCVCLRQRKRMRERERERESERESERE